MSGYYFEHIYEELPSNSIGFNSEYICFNIAHLYKLLELE